jgi:hypothetical protein
MWKLHNLIKNSLPKEDEKYLIHEVIKLMDTLSVSSFKDSLLLMYGEGFQINKNPAELALMFVQGLKRNNFFAFSKFVQSLSK